MRWILLQYAGSQIHYLAEMKHIPQNESLILDESQTLLRQGKYDDASVLLESLLEIDPHSKLALRTLANIRMSQNRPHDAAKLLELALGIVRDSTPSINAFKKSFGNEDAVYLKQEHERQTTRREYDPFSERLSLHKNQTYSPISAENVSLENEYDEANEQEISGIAHLDNIETLIDTNHGLINDELQNDEDYLFDQVISDEAVPSPELNLVQENVSVADHEKEEWETHAIVTDEIIDGATWEGLLDPLLIEPPPNPREIADIPDRVTRTERARQVAMKIGEEFGWERKGIELLAVIFDRYYWSAAQVAIRREIGVGMTPLELELAEEVRQIWYQHPEYWAALDGFGDIVQRYSLVSWPSALYIIRSFKGYPQSEEVEALLDSCCERWHESNGLQRRFKGFYLYALYRVGAYGDCFDQDGWSIFEDYQTDESDFDNVTHVARRLKHYGIHIDPHAERTEPRYWEERLVPNIHTCIPLPEGINHLPEAWDENTEDEEEE